MIQIRLQPGGRAGGYTIVSSINDDTRQPQTTMAARTRDDGGGATATASTMSDMEAALAMLQPIRDLSRNWDVDIASWYVFSLHA